MSLQGAARPQVSFLEGGEETLGLHGFFCQATSDTGRLSLINHLRWTAPSLDGTGCLFLVCVCLHIVSAPTTGHFSPSSGTGYVCEAQKSGDGAAENVGPDPNSAPWPERAASMFGARRQPRAAFCLAWAGVLWGTRPTVTVCQTGKKRESGPEQRQSSLRLGGHLERLHRHATQISGCAQGSCGTEPH